MSAGKIQESKKPDLLLSDLRAVAEDVEVLLAATPHRRGERIAEAEARAKYSLAALAARLEADELAAKVEAHDLAAKLEAVVSSAEDLLAAVGDQSDEGIAEIRARAEDSVRIARRDLLAQIQLESALDERIETASQRVRERFLKRVLVTSAAAASLLMGWRLVNAPSARRFAQTGIAAMLGFLAARVLNKMYAVGSVAARVGQKAQAISASDFVCATGPLHHVDISSMDVMAKDLILSPAAPYVQSLDIARLQLDNESVIALALSGRFQKLRWLDLSGNPLITYAGVSAIAESVKLGKLPRLQWVELLGTGCDATPYIDGCYWRMTTLAKELAKSYGYQNWMMLGSRIPELANKELLPLDQRRVPPDRFSLP